MATRSVLIIGGSGFVGTQLALRLREGYKVFATYHSRPFQVPGVTMIPLDVDNRNWIKRVIQTSKPDFLVFAAGLSKQGLQGRSYGELERIHNKGAATLMSCAEMYQPRFIYLSSCHVFDGDRGNYREGDAALPISALGKVKMAAENFIRSRSSHAIIIRSSPLFGRGNGLNLSFLDRLRMSLDRGKAIELAANEIHSFAPVEALAELVAELIAKPPARTRTLHFGGITKATYSDFGQAFARRFGYDPRLITAVMPKRDEPTGPHRGERKEILDFSLNSSQTVELLKIKPLLLKESFDLIQQKLIASA